MDDDEIEPAPPLLPADDVFDPEGADDPDARQRYFSNQRHAVLRRRDDSADPEPPQSDDRDPRRTDSK